MYRIRSVGLELIICKLMFNHLTQRTCCKGLVWFTGDWTWNLDCRGPDPRVLRMQTGMVYEWDEAGRGRSGTSGRALSARSEGMAWQPGGPCDSVGIPSGSLMDVDC